MPYAPKPHIVRKSNAKRHGVRRYDSKRESASKRGYDAKWRKFREQFLIKNPLCVRCKQEGYLKPANEVDHIIPHKGDKELFWDSDNLQALCKSCHSRKTRQEQHLGVV